MKALSIKQPYASLIATGVKTLEVRSWRTNYRGPLVIVASKQPDRCALERFNPRGALNGVTIALVELTDIREGCKGDKKAGLVDPSGSYVWQFRVIQRPPPVPVKGRLNLYELPRSVLSQLGIRSPSIRQSRQVPEKP